MSNKKKIPKGNQTVQFHSNSAWIADIYDAQEKLTAIYINVAEEKHKEKFDEIENLLDELKEHLLIENNNIATEILKTDKP